MKFPRAPIQQPATHFKAAPALPFAHSSSTPTAHTHRPLSLHAALPAALPAVPVAPGTQSTIHISPMSTTMPGSTAAELVRRLTAATQKVEAERAYYEAAVLISDQAFPADRLRALEQACTNLEACIDDRRDGPGMAMMVHVLAGSAASAPTAPAEKSLLRAVTDAVGPKKAVEGALHIVTETASDDVSGITSGLVSGGIITPLRSSWSGTSAGCWRSE